MRHRGLTQAERERAVRASGAILSFHVTPERLSASYGGAKAVRELVAAASRDSVSGSRSAIRLDSAPTSHERGGNPTGVPVVGVALVAHLRAPSLRQAAEQTGGGVHVTRQRWHALSATGGCRRVRRAPVELGRGAIGLGSADRRILRRDRARPSARARARVEGPGPVRGAAENGKGAACAGRHAFAASAGQGPSLIALHAVDVDRWEARPTGACRQLRRFIRLTRVGWVNVAVGRGVDEPALGYVAGSAPAACDDKRHQGSETGQTHGRWLSRTRADSAGAGRRRNARAPVPVRATLGSRRHPPECTSDHQPANASTTRTARTASAKETATRAARRTVMGGGGVELYETGTGSGEWAIRTAYAVGAPSATRTRQAQVAWSATEAGRLRRGARP